VTRESHGTGKERDTLHAALRGSESHEQPNSNAALPRQLTHCIECDRPFPEPVNNWDDYFGSLDEAAFSCGPCAEREGYLTDEGALDMIDRGLTP
jgi:hypothetical protein